MFDHKKIEEKWAKKWTETGMCETKDNVEGKENCYVLVEFPYPSGDLHIGHWYSFSITDAFARMKRLRGYNVLFPIGFDSFGLPAENASIKNNISPKDWTCANIDTMRKQLYKMGTMFDWTREVVTSNPDYYKWTQWLFLELYKNNKIYRGSGIANWCVSCNTVIANEQVINGKCERCDLDVIQKDIPQWAFRTKDYAEELITGLESVDWADSIKRLQVDWIGKSNGSLFSFELNTKDVVDVFTTRADTLFGVSYLVLSPELELVSNLLEKVENKKDVEEYIANAKNMKEIDRVSAEREKTGVRLKGIYAKHPATKEEIPVWIADYCLSNYATGAVMGVPAHDERDFEFAKKYELKNVKVVDAESSTEHGKLVNSGEFDGLTSEEGIKQITKKYGKESVQYKLRDWAFSRQRYWGCPIPIVYDPDGNPKSVPKEHLPWLLPEDVDCKPTGEPPLKTSFELKERVEKIFGKGYKPEYETMDTFVDSSWYFLRYTDPKNDKEFASKDKIKSWLPVNRYAGGAEHTALHLIYARFFTKALRDIGLLDFDEPFTERINRGLILGTDNNKMSKSKGNTINPENEIEKVGTDSVRLYLAFLGPANTPQSYPYNFNGLVGMRRFLERVCELENKINKNINETDNLKSLRNETIKKVIDDVDKFKFNTAISQIMIYTNKLKKEKEISKFSYEQLLVMLSMFAPYITEELWESIGNEYSVHNEKLEYGEYTKVSDIKVAVQVNGKLKGVISIEEGLAEEEVIEVAKNEVDGLKLVLDEKEKIIYVEGKILNIVKGKMLK